MQSYIRAKLRLSGFTQGFIHEGLDTGYMGLWLACWGYLWLWLQLPIATSFVGFVSNCLEFKDDSLQRIRK